MVNLAETNTDTTSKRRSFGSRIMKEPRECHCCGRVIAMRFAVGNNKAHARHKCPHGEWCISGHRLEGKHANAPKCNKCRDVVYAHLQHTGERGKGILK